MRKDWAVNHINMGIVDLQKKIRYRVEQKGMGSFISRHEILGIITEEYQEVIEEIKNNVSERLEDELLDLAVACILSYISIKNRLTEW